MTEFKSFESKLKHKLKTGIEHTKIKFSVKN